MSVTNDIKRIKKKLEVFEVEGSRIVMCELVQRVLEMAKKGEDILPSEVIDLLKAQYMVELNELREKTGKYRQQKIPFK